MFKQNQNCLVMRKQLFRSYGKDVKGLTVHAGTIYLNEEGDVYKVKKVLWHPDYDSYTLNNDVGLVKVKKEIVFNDLVEPVPIARHDFVLEEDLPCVLSGWGSTFVRFITRNDYIIIRARYIKIYT